MHFSSRAGVTVLSLQTSSSLTKNMNVTVAKEMYYIPKAKSNFTLWNTEYISTVFDLTKLDIAMSGWCPP